MFVFILLISSVLCGVQNLSASGTAESSEQTVTVTGRGSVSAAPDIVSLNLGVQSSNSDLNTAIEDNNLRIKKIIDVMRIFNVPESDYSASNFSVYYQPPFNSGTGMTEGVYNVNNNIFIKIKNISLIGEFIQQALNAGANQFYGLDYGIGNTEPLLKKARKLAVDNALALAEETAAYAGLRVGKIISIEETAGYGPGFLYGPMQGEGIWPPPGSNSIITTPSEKSIEVMMKIRVSMK